MRGFFTVTDDGDLRWYLGVRFDKIDGGYHAVQTQYIEKMLQKFGLEKAYHKDVPMDPTFSLD
eukprot:2609807-Rhodomonas_salina.1